MPSTPTILFLADQFADSPRDASHSYPGGAEQTDAALIAACPFDIAVADFSMFTPEMLDAVDVCVVGNAQMASREQLQGLAASGKAVLFEHDLRVCRHRGNYQGPRRPLHKHLQWCTCRVRKLRPLFERCRGIIYLTQVQRSAYRRNPFYREPRWWVLGSSVFDQHFFDRVDRYRQSPLPKEIDVAVAYSRHANKGFDRSLEKAFTLTDTPYVIQNVTPNEVQDVLERSATFIHLPRTFEPAGRMPVEARFLGNSVIGNARVGVMQEPWWGMDDDAALEHLKGAAARFWHTVEEWSRD